MQDDQSSPSASIQNHQILQGNSLHTSSLADLSPQLDRHKSSNPIIRTDPAISAQSTHHLAPKAHQNLEQQLAQDRDRLTNSSLFCRLPSSIGSQPLINQYLPDHAQKSVQLRQEFNQSGISAQELIQTYSWRALANHAREEIIQSEPSNTKYILQLWSYRFESLYQLKLPILLSKEFNTFFHTISQTFSLNDFLLNSTHQINSSSKNSSLQSKPIRDIIPFSILILRARLPILLKPYQHQSVMKTIDCLYELIEGCKRMVSFYSNPQQTSKLELWNSRIRHLTFLLASLFSGHGFAVDPIIDPINLKPAAHKRHFVPDRQLASDLLQKLEKNDNHPRWIQEEIRLWIEAGDLARADKLLESLDKSSLSAAEIASLKVLRLVAGGQWETAISTCQNALLNIDDNDQIKDSLTNNLVISLLYNGKLKQAVPTMSNLVSKFDKLNLKQNQSNSLPLLSSFIFNLSTLIDLSNGNSQQNKVDLLHETGEKNLLENVSINSFKLPIRNSK
ncbi:hypothetical protein O181_079155 [Austropuccinia psidii MF-1]|uniref:Uncharacterized protein n=1 Tax=Austropuccinia psidii MF-1 TaxID=1389203 RepID=A0A9Q3IHM6_9BASI|nr:hypothetical protein [Austropuccinia psidii MF-1]